MPKFSKTTFSATFFIFLLISLSFADTSEQLTITTYYPSPYGSYSELQLYPQASDPVCSDTKEGTLYYNKTDGRVKVCKNYPAGTLTYQYIDATGLWQSNATPANSISNTNIGNVGIGTTGPTATLTVNGATGAISQSGFAAGGSLRITEDPNSGAMFLIGTNGGNYGYIQYTNSVDKSIGYPLVLNPTAGNVGIGTTAPAKLLQVSGTGTYSTGAEQVRVTDPSNNTTVSILADGAKSIGVIYASRPGIGYVPLHIGLFGAVDTIINPNAGNVGIGTTNPQERLQVTGRIAAIGTGGTDAEIVLGKSTATNDPTWHIDRFESADRFSIFHQPDISTGGTEMFTITDVGNVGIKTNSPKSTASPGNGLTTGNLDVNDIWLRNGNKWVSASSGGGSQGKNLTWTAENTANFLNAAKACFELGARLPTQAEVAACGASSQCNPPGIKNIIYAIWTSDINLANIAGGGEHVVAYMTYNMYQPSSDAGAIQYRCVY